jgi:hypothetical protein
LLKLYGYISDIRNISPLIRDFGASETQFSEDRFLFQDFNSVQYCSKLFKMKTLAFITKLLRSGIRHSFLSLLIALFLLPSFLFADQLTHTYDKQSIRYPSMDTGQVWAKIGATPSPALKMGAVWISTKTGENSSSNLKTNDVRTGTTIGENSSFNLNRDTGQVRTTVGENSLPTVTQGSPVINNDLVQDTEIKKRLKSRRLKTIQALENGNARKASLNKSLPLKALNKENQKTSAGKSVQPRKTVSSEGTGFSIPKTRHPGKNWHHKQELYDVECGLKLARVVVTYYFDRKEKLLSSNISPDAEWYHIYPGSFEEELYAEICHPR